MGEYMKITRGDIHDVPELYRLQLLAFESEAKMIGSRNVPALLETEAENAADFKNWDVLKIVNDHCEIIAAIRYRLLKDMIEVGRLMVHPAYRRQGLACRLLSEVDKKYPDRTKELYTCTKSWTNICLYEKMGYRAFKEKTEDSGLSFAYMRKDGVFAL